MSKRTLLILLSVLLSLVIASTAAVIIVEKNKAIAKAPTETETKTNEPIPPKNIIPMDGDSNLSAKDEALLNEFVLKQLNMLRKGTPVIDENGDYHVDEYGELLCEKQNVVDYANAENNLRVLVGYFAEKQYTNEAIQQIQRMYFSYLDCFRSLSTDELIPPMEACFPQNGTTPEQLKEDAENILGIVSYDDFSSVFEDETVVDQYVPVCDVKIPETDPLSLDKERLCLYGYLKSSDEDNTERNLERWLHKIVCDLSEYGYGEKEIIEAELLFYGSLLHENYRSDLIDCIRSVIPQEQEIEYTDLCSNAASVFGTDISGNILLREYMKGNIAFEEVSQ